MHYGELPKRLKGAVSKTARRESVRGFKSLILRHGKEMPFLRAFFDLYLSREKIVRRFVWKNHHVFVSFFKQLLKYFLYNKSYFFLMYSCTCQNKLSAVSMSWVSHVAQSFVKLPFQGKLSGSSK